MFEKIKNWITEEWVSIGDLFKKNKSVIIFGGGLGLGHFIADGKVVPAILIAVISTFILGVARAILKKNK